VEVVVPMQIFSYLPLGSLRTPGAVWMQTAPVRSVGGGTPWSKMRICVASRTTCSVSGVWSLMSAMIVRCYLRVGYLRLDAEDTNFKQPTSNNNQFP